MTVINRLLPYLLALLIVPPWLPTPALSDDRAQVIWRITDWPPFYILSGPNKGQGVYDVMMRAYQAALPQYTHSTQIMTTQRALQQMKNRQGGSAVCHVSMLKRSLVEFAHVSKMNSVLLAHVIFAHRSAAARIRKLSTQGDGFVSVRKLFLDGSLKGAHTALGTHQKLDELRYREKPLPSVVITSESYREMALMFLNGRVDYIVQYHPFLGTLVKLGGSPDDIVMISIEETRNEPYVEVYAGCTMNDIGQVTIEAINRVLASRPPELRDARLKWYGEATRPELERIYKKLAPDLIRE